MLGRQFEQLQMFDDSPWVQRNLPSVQLDPHQRPGADYLRGSNAVGQRVMLPWMPIHGDPGSMSGEGPNPGDESLRVGRTYVGEHNEHGTITIPRTYRPDYWQVPQSAPERFMNVGPDHPIYSSQLTEHTSMTQFERYGGTGKTTDPNSEGWTVDDLRGEEIRTPPSTVHIDGSDFIYQGNHRISAMRRRAQGQTSFVTRG